MKQSVFEANHESEWSQLEAVVAYLEKPRGNSSGEISQAELRRFGQRYRNLVRQHALAVERQYSMGLIDRLQHLLQRAHQQLYRNRELLLQQIVFFLGVGFPSAVRRYAAYFWTASALFYLPALLMGTWCYLQADAIYSVMDAAEVAQMEFAYDPATEHTGRGEDRQSDTDFQMFGFYIWNNTSIGFRAFAFGLLFGIGTAFITVFNGVVIGAVAGHLTGLGYTQIFWPFVSGHGAFELTAIGISAAAGLLLGHALLAPGVYSRVDALKRAAAESVPLIVGAALFFFLAAFVEAFWSPSTVAAEIKYLVAAMLWLAVILYLVFAGRKQHAV